MRVRKKKKNKKGIELWIFFNKFTDTLVPRTKIVAKKYVYKLQSTEKILNETKL